MTNRTSFLLYTRPSPSELGLTKVDASFATYEDALEAAEPFALKGLGITIARETWGPNWRAVRLWGP